MIRWCWCAANQPTPPPPPAYPPLCTVHCAPCTLTLYIAHCTIYSAQFILNISQCRLKSPHALQIFFQLTKLQSISELCISCCWRGNASTTLGPQANNQMGVHTAQVEYTRPLKKQWFVSVQTYNTSEWKTNIDIIQLNVYVQGCNCSNMQNATSLIRTLVHLKPLSMNRWLHESNYKSTNGNFGFREALLKLA